MLPFPKTAVPLLGEAGVSPPTSLCKGERIGLLSIHPYKQGWQSLEVLEINMEINSKSE